MKKLFILLSLLFSFNVFAYTNAVNQVQVDKIVKSSSKIVAVNFGADWCPACKAFKPVIKAVDELGELDLVLVDTTKVEKDFKLVNEIKYIPTTIYYLNGKEVDRFVGYEGIKALKGRLILIREKYGK